MTKKARRSLFYGLLALFPLLGGAIILYAQGWRLDWETFGAKKVGAIYVRSFPEYADIRLNGKPVKNKSGMLDRGTFIGNLFPKNYTLTLSADGYHPWQEHITVKPSLVSEIKYGILVPSAPEAVATGSVAAFWIVNQEPVVQNEQGVLLRADKKLSGGRVVGWTGDFKKILTEDEKKKIYFMNDVSTETPAITNLDIHSSEFQKVLTDPGNGSNMLFQASSSVSALNTANNKLTVTAKSSSTITQFAASASWFAWTTFDARRNVSRLTLHNRSSKINLGDETFTGKNVKLNFRNDSELGILQNDGSFYIERVGKTRAEKTASDVRDFSFSQDGSSVAALEHTSIEIFSFNSENEYWRFRLPDNDTIERLEWYQDRTHLFIVYPQETRFLDLNDKTLENFPTIASGTQAYYDEPSNKLYFVKNNVLWSLTFPQ